VIQVRKLPAELTSLVHHVELNKAGWWDQAVQQVIVATIWLCGENLTLQGVRERLGEYFCVNLDEDRIRKHVDALCASGTLVPVQAQRFKIAEQSLNEFERGLADAEKMQEQVHQRFINSMASCCPLVDADATWQSFNDEFLVPLIHDMGARTYELISGTSMDLAAMPRLQHFLQRYPAEVRGALRTAVITFLDPKEPSIRSYILHELNAYFFLEAGNLSGETVEALTRIAGGAPTFTVLVDTNFLFCILGLDENPRNEAAQSLIHLVGQLPSNVAVKLYVSPITIDEARWVLQSCEHDLGGVLFTANLTDAALTTALTGLTRKFLEECSKAGQPLRAEDYFGPYVKDLVGIARTKGVELSDQKVDHYRTNPEVVDDLNEQLEFEKRFRDRPKGYRQLEHDIVLWHFVRDQRRVSIDSPVEADCWIVTVDFGFLGFDRHKRRNQVNNIPICVHPANFIQMLQFWVPRTQGFEEAVLGNLRLPFLFQEFDPAAEQVTIRILSALARFEKIDDLPQEVVASTLMNSALRQRLQAETDVEKDPELMSQVFAEENQRLSDELSGEKAKSADLEREARESTDTVAALRQREAAQKAAVRESERQLKEERTSRSSLEERLGTIQVTLREKQQREQITWFAAKWVVAPLALIAALGLGIAMPLAAFTAWGPFRATLTAVGVCSVSLILWVWLTDLRGSKHPVVSEWRPFVRFHALKNRLFALLGVLVFAVVIEVLANATLERLKEII